MRAWTALVAVLAAVLVVGAPTAARDRKPPRIVAAAMLDVNRDFRADRVRLTFSERVRHVVDRDGRYPFRVAGYRIRSVGRARGKTVVLLLAEKKLPDAKARPAVRYRRTTSRPVRDRAGNQALSQVFRKIRAHGRVPAAPVSAPTPKPPASTTPTVADADGDGTMDARDCAPRDPAIHPGAADLPDLGFVDANCDGIDGTETDAVFVSPKGSDANPGTKAKPKRDVQAAVDAVAAGKAKFVLVAFGSYGHVRVGTSGVGIYGGYDPTSWKRLDRDPGGLPLILGSPEGVFVSGAKGVVLQHLEIRSLNGTLNVAGTGYGVRAKNGASVTLQRVVVIGGDGAAGAPGTDGRAGASGGAGGPGLPGSCEHGRNRRRREGRRESCGTARRRRRLRWWNQGRRGSRVTRDGRESRDSGWRSREERQPREGGWGGTERGERRGRLGRGRRKPVGRKRKRLLVRPERCRWLRRGARRRRRRRRRGRRTDGGVRPRRHRQRRRRRRRWWWRRLGRGRRPRRRRLVRHLPVQRCGHRLRELDHGRERGVPVGRAGTEGSEVPAGSGSPARKAVRARSAPGATAAGAVPAGAAVVVAAAPAVRASGS